MPVVHGAVEHREQGGEQLLHLLVLVLVGAAGRRRTQVVQRSGQSIGAVGGGAVELADVLAVVAQGVAEHDRPQQVRVKVARPQRPGDHLGALAETCHQQLLGRASLRLGHGQALQLGNALVHRIGVGRG